MCRGHHHHHHNSPAPYGAYIQPTPYGGMNTINYTQPLALQDPNRPAAYLTTATSNWDSEYCSGCGRRAYKCRCDRRAARCERRGYCSSDAYGVSNGYADPFNSSHRRGRRNHGPVSLLVSAGVALYQHQKAKKEQKEEERRVKGVEFEEELRREEITYQSQRTNKHGESKRRRQDDEGDDEDEPDNEFDDEEQQSQDVEAQRRPYNGEQPPSYEAAMRR